MPNTLVRNQPAPARATVHRQRNVGQLAANVSVGSARHHDRPSYTLLAMDLADEQRTHAFTRAKVADLDAKNLGLRVQVKRLSADLATANRNLEQHAGCRDAFALGHAKLKEARETAYLEQAARVAAEATVADLRARLAPAPTNDDKERVAGELQERIDVMSRARDDEAKLRAAAEARADELDVRVAEEVATQDVIRKNLVKLLKEERAARAEAQARADAAEARAAQVDRDLAFFKTAKALEMRFAQDAMQYFQGKWREVEEQVGRMQAQLADMALDAEARSDSAVVPSSPPTSGVSSALSAAVGEGWSLSATPFLAPAPVPRAVEPIALPPTTSAAKLDAIFSAVTHAHHHLIIAGDDLRADAHPQHGASSCAIVVPPVPKPAADKSPVFAAVPASAALDAAFAHAGVPPTTASMEELFEWLMAPAPTSMPAAGLFTEVPAVSDSVPAPASDLGPISAPSVEDAELLLALAAPVSAPTSAPAPASAMSRPSSPDAFAFAAPGPSAGFAAFLAASACAGPSSWTLPEIAHAGAGPSAGAVSLDGRDMDHLRAGRAQARRARDQERADEE